MSNKFNTRNTSVLAIQYGEKDLSRVMQFILNADIKNEFLDTFPLVSTPVGKVKAMKEDWLVKIEDKYYVIDNTTFKRLFKYNE